MHLCRRESSIILWNSKYRFQSWWRYNNSNKIFDLQSHSEVMWPEKDESSMLQLCRRRSCITLWSFRSVGMIWQTQWQYIILSFDPISWSYGWKLKTDWLQSWKLKTDWLQLYHSMKFPIYKLWVTWRVRKIRDRGCADQNQQYQHMKFQNNRLYDGGRDLNSK